MGDLAKEDKELSKPEKGLVKISHLMKKAYLNKKNLNHFKREINKLVIFFLN